jgi:hypothetical protein
MVSLAFGVGIKPRVFIPSKNSFFLKRGEIILGDMSGMLSNQWVVLVS